MADMKQLIYVISLIILLGACTDEKYTDTLSSKGSESGELVPVELALNIQPVQSPLSSGTKAGGNAVTSTQVCKGLEITMVKTPVTRSATFEQEIKNFWVLQFNGTAPASVLIAEQFVNSNSVREVQLNNIAVKSRIIVIANAAQNTFDGLTINSTTLADFENMGISSGNTGFPLFNATDGNRIIYAGSTDMAVSAGKQADIRLYRTVARVKVKISLNNEMQAEGYSAWTCQFMNIPEKSFYYSVGRAAPFPGETVKYFNYTQQPISLPATIDKQYLPVNLHPPVPFTTPERRVTNAPSDATFLQIVGVEVAGGVIVRSVVYQVHLGSNFTDDYSISPNYSYTYDIKITGESEDDSRVIKFVPGYFGGELKMYKADGTVASTPAEAATWRYEKQIEVYVSDVNSPGGVKWLGEGSSMPLTTNSFTNGRQNTWALKDETGYTAMQKCISLNATTPQTIDDMVWYMPSYGESLSIYVVGSNTLKTLPDTYYWSSTTNGTSAWGTQVWTGASEPLSPTESYNLRCIKDLKSGETTF